MIKAKQRIENLEKKTGGTKRKILAIAHMKRVTRISNGETFEDMPEHKGCIGLSIEDLRKSLAAYYEDEERPNTLTVNSTVPRPGDRRPPDVDIIDVHRIITDDPRDLPGYHPPEGDRSEWAGEAAAEEAPGQTEETPKEKPLKEWTDEELDEALEKGEEEEMTDEEREIRGMTDEELDREIERAKKELKK